MKSKPLPDNWSSMQAHLEDDHGHDGAYVACLDAEDARRIHDWDHRERIFELGREHTHGA